MKVYLIRHGEAVSSHVDRQRPLSEQGRADVGRIASFIKPLGISVEHVWHSGKSRAAQTAEILAQAVTTAKGCLARPDLGPNADPATIAEEIEAYDADLMIVSHLPFLWNLASLLVAGQETADVVAFSAGTIVCLERRDPGLWQIDWMVAPELLA